MSLVGIFAVAWIAGLGAGFGWRIANDLADLIDALAVRIVKRLRGLE